MAVLWVGGGRLVWWGWGLCACTGGWSGVVSGDRGWGGAESGWVWGGAWGVWWVGTGGVGREVGKGVWYLSGVVILRSGVDGDEWGSLWAAACTWGSPVAGADPEGFGLCFLEEGGFEREGDS